MLWEIDIHPAEGQPDRAAKRVAKMASELGLAENVQVATARGYLVQGESLDRNAVETLARELLTDSVVERAAVGAVGDLAFDGASRLPGMDEYDASFRGG